MRKDVVGYEGLYQIDTDGNVWSIGYGKELILKQALQNNRYFVVTLCKQKKHKSHTIHRLIAEAFIPNPENKPQVNHINGDKKDNRIENLEWVTASENIRHAFENGLKISLKGEKTGSAKLKNSDIVEIFNLRKLGWTQQKIADKFGVCNQLISLILNKKNWKHIIIE